MKPTITIDRALLEQAMNMIPTATAKKIALKAAIRAELANAPAWHDAPETTALKAERDELRKDAKRLDYLQKHARCDPKLDGNHVWWPTSFNDAQNLRGATLREAIDAAMAKAEGGAT